MTAGPTAGRVAARFEVTGIVQGVGFRPFVHRLARELGLDGFVGNDSTRVFVEVAGPPDALDALERRLTADAPPLARVERVERHGATTPVEPGFRIVESETVTGARTLVPPDTAVCDDCLAEMLDPADRRYRHPFVTCTNCGPRFTIIRDLPYDRPATTMAGFPMCAACAAEYADPADRRYHAQPIACHDCGPTLVFRPGNGDAPAERSSAIDGAVDALRAGLTVAVKGLGGYHLACDATSGNLGGEPIAYRDDDAAERLAGLCDAMLTHDRPIHAPCDDSVVRLVGDTLLPVRRARGFAPVPIPWTGARRSVLAVGGELKNTFCLAGRDHAWVSQHLGDMENLATLDAFDASVAQFRALYAVEPDVVAVDAHPGYSTARWARDRFDASTIVPVQHHHAHVAAVMAEHGVDPAERVVGFAFDGTGYGTDGAIWGGEVLVADAASADRAWHLAEVPLPGGDAAIRNPYRVALAHLAAAGVEWADDLPPVRQLERVERGLLERQLATGFQCVPTTSMGRLFDAVASLLGLRHRISFEAQAAIDLELAAERAVGADTGIRFDANGGVVHAAPVVRGIIAGLRAGTPVGDLAATFHVAVAELVCDLAVHECRERGLTRVVLSGGVFQNALLTSMCVDRLRRAGIDPLTHRLVPPNDGGLALGQAFVAAHTAGARDSIDDSTDGSNTEPIPERRG